MLLPSLPLLADQAARNRRCHFSLRRWNSVLLLYISHHIDSLLIQSDRKKQSSRTEIGHNYRTQISSYSPVQKVQFCAQTHVGFSHPRLNNHNNTIIPRPSSSTRYQRTSFFLSLSCLKVSSDSDSDYQPKH